MLDRNRNLRMFNAKLDLDHEKMLSAANKLFGSTREERDNILNTLIQYNTEHFRVEEEVMKLFKYPKLEEHKNLHYELQSEILNQFTNVLHAHEEDPILRYIYHLIVSHIEVFDQDFATYLSDLRKREVLN